MVFHVSMSLMLISECISCRESAVFVHIYKLFKMLNQHSNLPCSPME